MKSRFIAGRSRSMTGNVCIVAHTARPKRYSRAPALRPLRTSVGGAKILGNRTNLAEAAPKGPPLRAMLNT